MDAAYHDVFFAKYAPLLLLLMGMVSLNQGKYIADIKAKSKFVSGRNKSSGREKPIDSQSFPGEIKLSLVQ